MLWDDHQCKCIVELSFNSDVKGVKLNQEKILVQLEEKLYVYNFGDCKLVDKFDTVKNPKGSIAEKRAFFPLLYPNKGIE